MMWSYVSQVSSLFATNPFEEENKALREENEQLREMLRTGDAEMNSYNPFRIFKPKFTHYGLVVQETICRQGYITMQGFIYGDPGKHWYSKYKNISQLIQRPLKLEESHDVNTHTIVRDVIIDIDKLIEENKQLKQSLNDVKKERQQLKGHVRQLSLQMPNKK